MRIYKSLLPFLAICNALPACRSGGNLANVQEAAAETSEPIHCTFKIPYSGGQTFEVQGQLSSGQLTDISAMLSTKGKGETKRLASAPLAKEHALDDQIYKPVGNRTKADRSVRAFEKEYYAIDRTKYVCFDISGVGPKSEDYLCAPRRGSKNVPYLWASNYRYARDLNVIPASNSCR